MGRVKDLEVERLENMTEEEQIKYEQEQAEADMAEARYLEECEKEERKENGEFLNANDEIPEPKEWFHDIFRVDGTPYDEREIEFIKKTVLG